MKKLRNIIFAFAIIAIILPYFTSVAFGFYDRLTKNDYIGDLQIGNWSNWINQTFSYSTGFESFTNTNTGNITLSIDGLSWDLNNVVQSQSSDVKIDTKSARILQNGTFTSTNYFTGLEVLSFYVAMSKLQGTYTFSVLVSDNGTQWTSVLSQNKPTLAMQLYSIDLQTMIQGGLTLASGATATMSTPLKIQFSFTSNKSIAFLLDNINFSCSAIS